MAIGPGLLNGAVCGHPVEFKIIARNDLGENRTSGRDIFEVLIRKELPMPEGLEQWEIDEYKPQFTTIECPVEDLDDGQYNCKYTCPEPGEIEITINFLDDKGKMVPIRGSPLKV